MKFFKKAMKTVNVLFVRVFSEVQAFPAGICLLYVGNGDTDIGCKTFSGLGLEAPERC